MQISLKGGSQSHFKMAELDITHLNNILDELKLFSKDRWESFGLKAGLYQPTLNKIKANHKDDVDLCFKECLTCWLKKEDKVNEEGEPTWLRLADIVEYTGDRARAEKIKKSHYPHDTDDSSVEIRNATETLDDSNSGTIESVIRIDDYDIESEYKAMEQQLANILAFAIIDIDPRSFEVIRLCLTGLYRDDKKIIHETNSKIDLMALLRSYYSLSNVSALKDFAERCKIKYDSQELDALLKRLNTFYEKILATDFAKKAIEDHKLYKSALIITFKVSWNPATTKLKEFEEFLKTVFKIHKIHIRLKVVHQSLLTFVCSIPNWLLEEITEFVIKNKDDIISKGVVEVTIDSAVIFNVEGGYAAVVFYEPNDMMTFTAVPSNQLPTLLKESSVGTQSVQQQSTKEVPESNEDVLMKEVESLSVIEKPQLLEETNKLEDTKELNDFISQLKEINDEILSSQKRILAKNQDLLSILTNNDSIMSKLFVTEDLAQQLQETTPGSDKQQLLKKELQENSSRALSVQQQLMTEGNDLMQKLSENEHLLEKVIISGIPRVRETKTYAGIIYYEEKGVENVVTFTAAANLNALLEYIKREHPQAEIGQHVSFSFEPSRDYIELMLDTQQKYPYTGWIIQSHSEPCRLYCQDILNF
uniref:Death domain-containing protein n=1 Tax=Amphimedon queenslandica TaxID=400682 RepID=A0A1X7T4S4_AMPQE